MEERGTSSLGRKHILYRGYYYDVTEFIPRHPGGEILIGYYVNNREDASEAIDQFHFRSEKKVGATLKSLPKRKATERELISAFGGDKERYKRNQALTKDFANLFHELKEEGLFDPSIPHIFFRLSELVVLGFLTLYSLLYVEYKLLGASLLAVAVVRSSNAGHEAGHNSLTGKPWLERSLAFFGFYSGMSLASWRDHHNQHHAMPQHVQNDIDMNTLPIIAFHEKVVTNRRQFWFLVKYQKWFIYLIQSSIVGLWWKFVEHPLYCWQNEYYWELFWMIIHYAVFPPIMGLKWYLFSGYVAVTMMFINATLNHSHLPIPEESTHWVEYSLLHTANITPSLWMDYYMGYLNYQVEHHLFPTMPQFKNKLASERVKALAEKHGLPYQVYDWWTILRMTLDNLGKVSEELDSRFKKEDLEKDNILGHAMAN